MSIRKWVFKPKEQTNNPKETFVNADGSNEMISGEAGSESGQQAKIS